jgi:ribA/ribD-fused uncharacterized protein
MGKQPCGPVLFYEPEGYELSMFAARTIRWKDQDWPTGEHIFQAENFTEDAGLIRERIRRARNPRYAKKLAKKLARRFPECVRPGWKDGVRDQVMAAIIDEIVLQHPEVRKTLIASGGRLLIENSPHHYWGWGEDGNGKNRLGKLWMVKRAELERERLCS